jgi:hypothetical protein
MTPKSTDAIAWDPVPSSGGVLPSLKWAAVEIGTEYRGIWLGSEPGKFGPLGQLQTDDGAVLILPLPTALRSRVLRIPPGTKTLIVYMGKEFSKKTQKEFHTFSVSTPKGTTLLPPPTDERPDF